MNRHEIYLAQHPILTMVDLQGYWVKLQDIVDGLELPPPDRPYDDYEEYEGGYIEGRQVWARRELKRGGHYARIYGCGPGTSGIHAQAHPPPWSCKHVSKHPSWKGRRYE